MGLSKTLLKRFLNRITVTFIRVWIADIQFHHQSVDRTPILKFDSLTMNARTCDCFAGKAFASPWFPYASGGMFSTEQNPEWLVGILRQELGIKKTIAGLCSKSVIFSRRPNL